MILKFDCVFSLKQNKKSKLYLKYPTKKQNGPSNLQLRIVAYYQ